MDLGEPSPIDIYDNANYSIIQKEAVVDRFKSAEARLLNLKEEYSAKGMRRSIDAVMLVEVHRHPHVLLFQPGPSYFQLPGGELKPSETVQAGTNRVLSEYMLAEGQRSVFPIAGLLGQWWRPNFEPSQYPYNPPHVSDPKEHRRMVLIQLPKQCTFHLPANYTIKAVPLFELHDNKEAYGPILSSVPQVLSRFEFRYPSSLNTLS